MVADGSKSFDFSPNQKWVDYNQTGTLQPEQAYMVLLVANYKIKDGFLCAYDTDLWHQSRRGVTIGEYRHVQGFSRSQ